MSFLFFQKKEKVQEPIKAENRKIDESQGTGDILVIENIRVGEKSVSKEAAIEMAGQILVASGYVQPEYIAAMMEREKVTTTYIGEGIAIPHGVGAAREKIIKSGICILQFPEGVSFGEGKIAYLVVGIAGKANEHMKIITNLAQLIQDSETMKKLFTTNDRSVIFDAFTGSF